jgi:hypothetical protein
MAAYTLLACFIMAGLDANLYPPGFTGDGVVGLLAVFVCAYHLGRRLQSPIAFLMLGCLPATFHVLLYLDNYEHVVFGETDGGWNLREVTTITVGGVAYVLAAGFITRSIALIAWKRSHRLVI